MSNTSLNLRHLVFSLRLSNKLLASSLLLGLLGGAIAEGPVLGTSTISYGIDPLRHAPVMGKLIAQSENTAPTHTVAEQLLGQWEAKDPVSGQTLIFIFAPEGKLFIVLPSDSGAAVAQEVGYRIKPTPKPMQIDIALPGGNETVMTIFELTADSKLRLQLSGTNPGKPRPTVFAADDPLFQKISDATTLPANAQLLDLEAEANKARQTESLLYIEAMNRAQEAFYLERNKFATEIDDLEVGIPLETDNYRYQIVPPDDSPNTGSSASRDPSVMMTASAKRPDLKSYMGAVFVVGKNGEGVTISVICETNEPSFSPPAMPNPPKNASEKIQCPADSHIAGG